MNFATLLIPGASAVAAFFLCYGVVTAAWDWRDPTQRGLDELVDERIREPGVLTRMWVTVASMGDRLLPVLGGERTRIEEQLYLAGLRRPSAPALFLLSKMILVLLLPVGVWLATRSATQLSQAQAWSLIGTAVVAALVLPNWWLARRVRHRQAKLRNGFPDALDMLVICVEAGLGLTAAIERVTAEVRRLHPDLAGELAAVNAEMRSGVDRTTALLGLNARTGLPEIRGLVSLLVQTLQLGTGIADALRIYAAEFRDQRMQRAEERAAKTGTKMIFPLVLCELPAFFLVAVGPATLRLLDAFSG